MLLKIFLLRLLPRPGSGGEFLSRIPWVGRRLAQDYRVFYFETEAVVVRWHRSKLMQMAPDFQMDHVQKLLLAERRRLDEEGVSHADPRYPSLRDFVPSLPPDVAKPRS